MNSGGATKSLGGTLLDARGIVHDKPNRNIPQKPHFLYVNTIDKIHYVTRSSLKQRCMLHATLRLRLATCVNRVLVIQNMKGKERAKKTEYAFLYL